MCTSRCGREALPAPATQAGEGKALPHVFFGHNGHGLPGAPGRQEPLQGTPGEIGGGQNVRAGRTWPGNLSRVKRAITEIALASFG